MGQGSAYKMASRVGRDASTGMIEATGLSACVAALRVCTRERGLVMVACVTCLEVRHEGAGWTRVGASVGCEMDAADQQAKTRQRLGNLHWVLELWVACEVGRAAERGRPEKF